MGESDYTATYSPEDNKLRLYAGGRLPAETYAQAKAHGFRWAPKQELFVAPMWTPDREDFLLDLAGEIDDEDKSLVERAEERSERFEDYSDNRKDDAERAHAAVSAIADGIPFGQPILVGHHSEKHARRDAKKIENGMRRAIKMWEQSEYWIDRAKGAIRHAKYKELPAVRARRIKGIEADKRKQERSLAEAIKADTFWNQTDLTREAATAFAGRGGSPGFTMPRKEGDRPDFDQRPSDYTALTGDYPTLYAPRSFEEILAAGREVFKPRIKRATRWIGHYENRLTYERAMLNEQGAGDLLKPKKRPVLLPICNYRQEVIGVQNRWHKGEYEELEQVELTSAQLAPIHPDFKGTRVVDNSHRVRIVCAHRLPGRSSEHGRLLAVFLTDSKEHPRPKPQASPEPVERRPTSVYCPKEPEPQAAPFEAMKQSLKAGVKVVSAPQLFPTPRELAERIIEEADIQPGDRVLEPSAGTGNLITAIIRSGVVCDKVSVEIVQSLARVVQSLTPDSVICADFLDCNGDLGKFDRIVMNPPFVNGADIKHIQHARKLLKPGGRLVALCANGPRQREALQPIADTWENLPAGSFSEQGTNVNVALLIINAPAAGSLF